MILGIDVGYSNTKIYSKEGSDIFLSTMEEGTNEVNKKAIKIEYKNKEYTIGEKTGKFSVDLNKIKDETFILCLYTAIARQMKDTVADIELVTGLPAEYFKSQKQELINSLEGTTVNLVINDEPKRFTIKKVLVFPQSAGLFILNPQNFEGNDNIVIDIGGLTVDVSVFDSYTLKKPGTYELGMLKLYDKVVQALKSEPYSVSYDLLAAEKIINTKKIIKDGKSMDVADLINKILRDHTDLIIRTVKNGFSEYDTCIRNFVGGGAYMLKDYLPVEVKKDDIYTNAKAFYKIGVDKFED
ncbi:ParM/StbA family protein [Clostridium beijerinckii]|uniref:ParM/StbA family protein n=1 Tax=Clostridium beijerinckii TaxID=1520 RepID=UPI001361CFA2|nr:ParM/StbA family protein [Clostridium beijerinckii]MZK53308.1 StbA family protein [Clostridium beijerinckii]MZK61413.1 StbA family protein [Clostridium beijerinckii]MZK71655.1 StbA family protein [Clostridium beijerinckii]MZK77048.1 StbA family protein [Clostridium beijerinckii]MZK86703.1 StbA family protein [Clostridium beijerinckii]